MRGSRIAPNTPIILANIIDAPVSPLQSFAEKFQGTIRDTKLRVSAESAGRRPGVKEKLILIADLRCLHCEWTYDAVRS